ncbi:MAG: hypothetical protein WAM14_07270 [Candidatus Nitrosopolaris sp.]
MERRSRYGPFINFIQTPWNIEISPVGGANMKSTIRVPPGSAITQKRYGTNQEKIVGTQEVEIKI